MAIASTNGDVADRSRQPSAGTRASRRRAGERRAGSPRSRPAARSPGPKISSISPATNSEPVCTDTPRAIARRTSGTSAAHLGRAQLGIAHERAVVDAHERRETTGRREVVRRVDDACRAEAAGRSAARHRAPTPRAGSGPARERTASRAERRRCNNRARVHSVCTGRESGAASRSPSAATISATAFPMPLRAPRSGVTSIATAGCDGRAAGDIARS